MQTILGAIKTTVAHSDRYSLRIYCNLRTERLRVYGENFVFFFMALSSQELKPHNNPGRFMCLVKHFEFLSSRKQLRYGAIKTLIAV